MNDPPRLRDLLDPITARFGMDGASAAGAIWSRWTEVVGESVARHAEPTSLRRGVLRVRTDSPVWATEIGYLADDIRGRANAIAQQELVREVHVWTSNAAIARRDSTPRAVPQQIEDQATRSVPSDPSTALDRARNAWRKRVGKSR
jgi:predicted nucleic acid-binding Zn ribbon protein